MQIVTIPIGKKVRVTAQPKDPGGFDTALTGVSGWSADDPNGVALLADPNAVNNQSVFVAAKQKLGTFFVTASSNGVSPAFQSQFQVNVVAGTADHFDFAFDAPVAQ